MSNAGPFSARPASQRRRLRRRLLPAALGLLVLLGCRTVPVDPESSHHYTIPTGSRLALNHALEVPAGHWSLFFQDGEAKIKSIDEYRPYCRLNLSSARPEPWTVEPDTFTIIRVDNEVDARKGTAASVASLRLTGGVLRDFALVDYMTRLHLRSREQRFVRRLSCGYRGEPGFFLFLNVAQIREALGGHFTLELTERPQDHS